MSIPRLFRSGLSRVRAWTDQATAAGLGHGDAKMVAHVRASAHVRNIRNPVLLSQNTKDIAKMRVQGVNALRFEPTVALKRKMPSRGARQRGRDQAQGLGHAGDGHPDARRDVQGRAEGSVLGGQRSPP